MTRGRRFACIVVVWAVVLLLGVVDKGRAATDQRTVTVGVCLGAGVDYTSLAAADAAIGSAWCIAAPSTGDPCTIKFGTGVFDLGAATYLMRPWVNLEGTAQGATILRGSNATQHGVVRGSADAILRDLAVENTGGGAWSVGISAFGGDLTAINVTARARAGISQTIGVYGQYRNATLTEVTAEATGTPGGDASGISLFKAPGVSLTDTQAEARGGLRNAGIRILSCTGGFFSNRVRAIGTGGSEAFGLYLHSNSGLTIGNVQAEASGAGTTVGVFLYGGSVTIIDAGIRATGGADVNGVKTWFSATGEIDRATITATSGTTRAIGVYNHSKSNLTVRESRVSGDLAAVVTQHCSTTALVDDLLDIGSVGVVENWPGSCATGPNTNSCTNVYQGAWPTPVAVCL